MWWEKCFTSEGEQKAFTPFSSNVYTEDLLNLHENLAEKLKMLHGANKEIFTKVLQNIQLSNTNQTIFNGFCEMF